MPFRMMACLLLALIGKYVGLSHECETKGYFKQLAARNFSVEIIKCLIVEYTGEEEEEEEGWRCVCMK